MELALKDEQIIWQRQLAGVSLYYNFFMRKYENNSAAYLSKKSQNEKRQWEDAIIKICNTDIHNIQNRKFTTRFI